MSTNQDAESNKQLQIELVRIKLEQSAETIRSYLTLLTQIITVIVVANVTTIGFAIQSKQGVILFIGAIYYFGIWISFWIFGRLISVPVYTIFCLENEFQDNQLDWPSISSLPFNLSYEFVEKLYSMRESNNSKIKFNKINRLRVPILGPLQRIVNIILIFLACLQIIIPIILPDTVLPLW